jgi:membrane protein implicated in regulation of membrane protease activity
MWSGAILIIVGAAIGAPAGGLFCMGLAALCALVPIIVGPIGPRIGGAVILVIALAAQLYPLYQKEQERYRERATKSQATQQQAPLPSSP